MKKILITGAGSYIGTSFENYLKNFGDEYSVDTVDMIDGSWKEKSFSGYDAVFHVAGIVHKKETNENVSQYYTVNRDLTVEVAKKAKNEGVRQFVFLSSMSVYGIVTGRITAGTEPKPKNNYGESKLQAERKISEMNDDLFKICVLRPPMIYGKGCKGNYKVLRKLAIKLKVFPYVKNERSMLFIDNLCEFVRLMIDNVESGSFFPQNDEYVNTSAMVQEIAKANGKKIRLMHGTAWAVKLLSIISTKAKKAFGTLTYDKSMSVYEQPYNVVSHSDSVLRTEK